MNRGKLIPRSQLAFSFWPDSTEKQAFANLRHLLHLLRKAIPDEKNYIRLDGKTVYWSSSAPYSLDVECFESAISQAKNAVKRDDSSSAAPFFEKAVNLYAGDLLPGCYDDWIDDFRESLRNDYADALEWLVCRNEEERNYSQAIRFCNKLRQFEPARESTYVTLMRLLSTRGDRTEAIKVYRECVANLKKELDVEPSAQTRELHNKLLSDQFLDTSADKSSTITEGPELPLRGRHTEWRQLKEAWSRSIGGEAHFVTITGEAGIGKSRLAEELYVTLRRQGIAASRTRSYAAEGRLAYAPVCQWLRSPALRSNLDRIDPVWLTEISRIMPEIKAERPDAVIESTERATWQRQLLFEALSRAVLAKDDPVMLLLDDMQWTDRETIEWLWFLLRYSPGKKLLVAGTMREEELTSDHPIQDFLLELRREGQITEIQLGPTSEEVSVRIAADVAGREFEKDELNYLYESTGGNPLFVVESVRAGLREDNGKVPFPKRALEMAETLPPKVHAVFSARLQQISSEAREISSIASVLGCSFTLEMLVDVSGKPEEDIIEILDELWERRIIIEIYPGMYDFTHDKLREVNYKQINTPKRRLLHRKASDSLEKSHSDDLDKVMAQLASHYAEAGQTSKAVIAFQKAAIVAKNMRATQEAIRLFRRSLLLLESLPENQERLARQLEINIELGACLITENSYIGSAVKRVYERAASLCEQLDQPVVAPILRNSALVNILEGRMRESLKIGEEILIQSDEQKDDILYVEGKYIVGVSYFWIGNFIQSEKNLLDAIRAYNPEYSHIHISLYAQDPGAVCLCRLAWCQFFLGKLDRAMINIRQAVVLATNTKHFHTQWYVLHFSAQISKDLGDLDASQNYIEQFDRLSSNDSNPIWESRIGIVRGHVMFLRNQDPRGIDMMERNLTRIRVEELGFMNGAEWMLCELGNAYLMNNDCQGGLKALENWRALLDSNDEEYADAELLHVEAKLRQGVGADSKEVEKQFRFALELSQQQSCKLIELRIACSLAKLLHAQCRTPEATELLRRVYDQFEEGFSFPDLVAAKTLIEEWNGLLAMK